MRQLRKSWSLSDFVQGRLSPEESLQALDDLEKDPGMSQQLEIATLLSGLGERYGPVVLEEGREHEQKGKLSDFRVVWRRRISFALLYAIACSGLLIAGLIGLSAATSGRFVSLAQPDMFEFESLVRGENIEDFTLAHHYYAEGRIDDAIKVLERFTRAYPNATNLDYAHLAAGSLYLVSAKKGFFSLFITYEKDRVEKGLKHLEASAQVSVSIRIVEEARILKAKGYLMLDQPDNAMFELRQVVLLQGVRSGEAGDLLGKISTR